MQLSHPISSLEDAVETQLRVAGSEVAEIGAQLMMALKPAIRQAMMDVVAMAATEISSQLPAQNVEIRLIDGDPEMILANDLSEIPAHPSPPRADDAGARITIRLPGYLKDLIADAAATSGDSVNTYVIDALRTQLKPKKGGATRHRATIEL